MKLQNIETAKIDRNPQNPRGINVVEEDEKLGLLMDSIEQFGILVPLVVTPENGRYILVDGERRYEAARSLGLVKVPAYVTEKGLSDKDVLLRMFHIHHNREQWGPIQECMALEDTYEKIRKRPKIKGITAEDAKIQAIAEELSKTAGIEFRTARDRVLFLRWPEDVKNNLYKIPSGAHHYIVEIENGIILPALKNYPDYFENVPVNEVRRFLLEKISVNAVGRGIEVRVATPIVKFQTHKTKERKKILRILDDLVRDKNMTYQDAREEFDRQFPEAASTPPPSPRKLLSAICNLCEQIEVFDPESFERSIKRAKASKKDVMSAMQRLIDMLNDLQSRIKINRS
ncbi:MAG: ParB/RepB/Spo0J family partition protein [Promethearchaeota archaeon]